MVHLGRVGPGLAQETQLWVSQMETMCVKHTLKEEDSHNPPPNPRTCRMPRDKVRDHSLLSYAWH